MSKVFQSPSNDSAMENAAKEARLNFKFFWREMTWEFRRIIPAMEIACVKARFTEGEITEYLWANVLNFDGDNLIIEILNSPNNLKEINANDEVSIPLKQLYDWLYALSGEVFGGYTINLMRSRMSIQERKSHDSAWGLNFGDPKVVEVVPKEWLLAEKKGFLKKTEYQDPNDVEHPMALNMVQGFNEGKFGEEVMSYVDDYGKTTLHDMALGGAAQMVEYLISKGMDKNITDKNGNTPLSLSRKIGWENVSHILAAN